MFVRKRISHKPMRFFEGAEGNKFTMTTLMWFLTTSAVCYLNKTGLRQLSTSFSEASVNSKSCAQAWLLVTLRWENIRSSEVTQMLLVVWYSHSDESVSPFQLTLGQWKRRTVAKFQTQKINAIHWIRFRSCNKTASIYLGRRASAYERNPTSFLTSV